MKIRVVLECVRCAPSKNDDDDFERRIQSKLRSFHIIFSILNGILWLIGVEQCILARLSSDSNTFMLLFDAVAMLVLRWVHNNGAHEHRIVNPAENHHSDILNDKVKFNAKFHNRQKFFSWVRATLNHFLQRIWRNHIKIIIISMSFTLFSFSLSLFCSSFFIASFYHSLVHCCANAVRPSPMATTLEYSLGIYVTAISLVYVHYIPPEDARGKHRTQKLMNIKEHYCQAEYTS